MKAQRVLRAVAACLATLIILLWVGNFAWILAANQQYGGTAGGGYVRDGHYFVGEHGAYTEVSRAIWERIQVHELGMFLGMPLVFASVLYLMFSYVFPVFMGLRRGSAVEERVRAVRASGPRLAAGRCSGSVGGMPLRGPFIYIEVFRGGITVRIFLFPRQPTAILKSELRSISAPRRGRYEILHVSPDLNPPLGLFLSPLSELAATLNRWALELPPPKYPGLPKF